MTDNNVVTLKRRYEVSVLIGPCTQEHAESVMETLHEAADLMDGSPGTSLNYWDEENMQPGLPVDEVEVL